MKIIFVFVLFLKASGYFLMPSSVFPERELTSPHGFLAGEGGASPRSPQHESRRPAWPSQPWDWCHGSRFLQPVF